MKALTFRFGDSDVLEYIYTRASTKKDENSNEKCAR
jgi:hypothetical protein